MCTKSNQTSLDSGKKSRVFWIYHISVVSVSVILLFSFLLPHLNVYSAIYLMSEFHGPWALKIILKHWSMNHNDNVRNKQKLRLCRWKHTYQWRQEEKKKQKMASWLKKVLLLTFGPALCSQLAVWRSEVILDTHTESYTLTSDLSPPGSWTLCREEEKWRKNAPLSDSLKTYFVSSHKIRHME